MIIGGPVFIYRNVPAGCGQASPIYLLESIRPRTITCTFVVCVSLILALIPVIYDLSLPSESSVRIGIAFCLIVALVAIVFFLPVNIYHRVSINVPGGRELIGVIKSYAARTRLMRVLRLLLKEKYFTLFVAIIIVVTLVVPLIPRYGFVSNEVNPSVLKNIPAASGVLSGEILLEKEGELSFEYGMLNSEEILAGDEPSDVYIGKDQIDHGLIYLKVLGADESKLNILLVPNGFMADGGNMRPYGEGYYPLVHGSGEYVCVVLAEQNDGTYMEAFRTVFFAEFDANDPYNYSNVFSMYSEESRLARKAYELTYNLDDRDAMAKRIKNYLSWNFRYSYGSEGFHELVDNDAIYDKGEGVCYHYASLYSSMMKSIGIPTREVRGYVFGRDLKYHSWNEYLNENDEWIPIDATGALKESGFKYVKTEFSER